MRTSSATNVGRDKDSEVRQRAAIESYAKAAGYTIVDWFYDPAVKGSDAVTERPGFKDMLDRIASNSVRTIIVESPDRFARDLAGHDFLKNLGVSLIPATAPDFFLEDTPTAVLVRQVLGAIAQFEKASLVAKLKAARDRKIAQGIRRVENEPLEQDDGFVPGVNSNSFIHRPVGGAQGSCQAKRPSGRELGDDHRTALVDLAVL